ncbi:hypothetical protein PGS10_07145 [Klebsiella sp. 141153]|uniref:hypothetical protein n=1 Tax=Klebsiella sp. 141153 TaxID=3020033 RepID=UPI0029285E93|nr:hypothetical protein [Klebsiella sp. 141153]MDU9354408.1 hypothetical protein [Klebsiella sp. 141153]
MATDAEPLSRRVAASPYPAYNPSLASPVGPRKRSAAGQSWQRTRSRFRAGWRLRLTRPTTPRWHNPLARASVAPPGNQ